MSFYLGCDTSAYTTSLAIVNEKAELLWDQRMLLKVPEGERGLAQSAALFQHVQNLPAMVARVPAELWNDLKGIGVSKTPRPVDGSYMPVFTVGYGIAVSLAAGMRIPCLESSHQEGHLAAGIHSSLLPQDKDFLALHISGGTTELLHVCPTVPGKLRVELLGGTNDLHAGQFVDRIGVRLGLAFPAGKALEELARQADPEAATWLPSAVRGLEVSFSGVETAAQRLITQQRKPADVARAVEGCIARTMVKLIIAGIEKKKIDRVLIVGGVAANRYLRTECEKKLHRKAQIYWAEPDWSRDNAIGVAVLAAKYFAADVN